MEEIIIGKYIISTTKDEKDKVWIFREDGEGGAFKVADLESCIDELYEKEL